MRTTLRVAQAILKKNQIQDTMTKEEIDYLIRQLTQNTKKSAHTILKIKPERIHTFIPGLIILKEMMTQFQIEHLTINYCFICKRQCDLYHFMVDWPGYFGNHYIIVFKV